MKCLFVIVGIVFVLVSCDTDSVNNHQTNEPQHYTVTYHGNGHTSGEVPVDSKQYAVPVQDYLLWKVPPETAFVLEPGTMEKEGYLFDCWRMRHPDYTDDDPKYINGTYRPREVDWEPWFSYAYSFQVKENIDFDAIWR
jgi:hypothetical protein